MSVDLVVLGNLLVDDMVFHDGRTRMAEPGGAALYVSLGAALWGLRTGVASVRGDEYPESALEALVDRGIDLSGIRPLGRPGVRTWLLYESHRRQVIHRLDGPTHADVSPGPDDIPAAWRTARAFHLAPMPFDAQRLLVESLSSRSDALVSVDPYMPLRPETLQLWRGPLEKADVLLMSEDDMELCGTAEDPRTAVRSLAAGRLRLVVFKRGVRGGLAYDAGEERFAEWVPRADRVVDPTGGGDAFAGGLLAGLLGGEPLERALQRAVVSASFALEDWGPAGILAATPEAAQARLSDWFGS